MQRAGKNALNAIKISPEINRHLSVILFHYRHYSLSLSTRNPMQSKIDIRVIEFDSKAYKQSLTLREAQLRHPIGLRLTEADVNGEAQQIHFAALSNENVVGICVLNPGTDNCYQLRQMAVDKAFKGEGIGHALLLYVESTIKKKGCKQIWMDARESARAFYEKAGYRVESEPFAHLGLAHIKMIKHFTDKA